jgi:pimeloyl-ACP methyl ester carboxylesterase
MRQLCLNRGDISLAGDSLGAGPTALLLHAGGESRAIWYPIMRNLDEAGLGSVAFDQRGHGHSGGSREDSVTVFGDDAAAMIEAGACSVVVGASLGGFAAMLALAMPDVQAQAAGLILVDVIPDPDPARVRAFLGPLGMAEMPVVDDILGRADQLRAAAASLVLPVLLVRAGRSSAVDDDDLGRLSGLIPQLEAVSVPDSGHLIAREASGALAALVQKFMHSDAVRDRRISRFVQRRAGDTIGHPGGTLAAHLARVADQLRRWAADAVVVDAARLHAAYGTAGFGPAVASTSDRTAVVRIVGPSLKR